MEEVFLRREFHGASWAQVCRALDWSNIGEYIAGAFDDFLLHHQLGGEDILLVAHHSWGGRDWTVEEGREPLFFPEPAFGGGWSVFREGDVSSVWSESATSGSWLEATLEEDGAWRIVLQVPFEGDAPYKGAYWTAYQAALEMGE